MKVKIKRLHPDAEIPRYANEGDAALDIVALEEGKNITVHDHAGQTEYIEYKTGLAIEIPKGYVGLIFPRSSISNYTLSLSNSVGVIDSSYRGEITFRFVPNGVAFADPSNLRTYEKGEKIGQLLIIPYPKVQFKEVVKLSNTTRGHGAYGSSGL